MANRTFSDDDLTGNTYLGEGEHVVVVKAADEGKTKEKQEPMIILTVADSYGRERKEYIVDTPKMQWKVALFARACGFTDEQLKEGVNIPSCFKGKKLQCVVTAKGKRTYNGKEYDKHEAEFFPLNNSEEGSSDWSEEEIPF